MKDKEFLVGKTICPRCRNNEAVATKTKSHAILRCEKCGFDMGAPLINEVEE